MTRHLNVRWMAAMAGVVVASSALAGGALQRLPGDYVFARGDGSPGPVTFSHASHVDAAKPSCLGCHSKSFRILESGRTASRDPIRHDRMEAGAACGACHGKAAFGFESCENCHK
jgi:c(7)-type cytochrome triheme protein